MTADKPQLSAKLGQRYVSHKDIARLMGVDPGIIRSWVGKGEWAMPAFQAGGSAYAGLLASRTRSGGLMSIHDQAKVRCQEVWDKFVKVYPQAEKDGFAKRSDQFRHWFELIFADGYRQGRNDTEQRIKEAIKSRYARQSERVVDAILKEDEE